MHDHADHNASCADAVRDGNCQRDDVTARARAYASSKGLPFTVMRERVLALLSTSLHPLTAYEIADRLSQTKKVQAVQVYRALDFLQEAGCIHRLTARSSYFACDHKHAHGETVVFMLCSQCGVVQEAASDVVGRGLRSAAKSSGFKPSHPIIEIEGKCAKCSEGGD